MAVRIYTPADHRRMRLRGNVYRSSITDVKRRYTKHCNVNKMADSSGLGPGKFMLLVTLLKYPDNRLNILEHISFSSTKTRSSTHLKLKQHRSRTNLSRHFYFSRICRLWNALPPIDLTLSTDNIRRAVKRFLWSNFIDKFDCDILCTFHFVCQCTKCSSMPIQTNY